MVLQVILFHVLYKDINNGKNYKKNLCWKPKPIYISWSAVMSPNKPFQFSLKIQSSILVQPLFWYLVSSAMYCKFFILLHV